MRRRNVDSSNDRVDKRSLTPVHVGGVGLCLFCTALTFIGTTSVVDALNRDFSMSMNQPITYISADADVDTTSKDDVSVSDSANKSDDVSVKGDADEEFKSDQLEWAHRYRISWDSAGNPVDENGNVMNDPTTSCNEVVRAMKNGTANEDGVSIDWLGQQNPEDTSDNASVVETPAHVPDLYQGVEGVSKTADGQYVYTVKSGDSIGKIAGLTGVSSAQIIDMNSLSNPSMIYVGEQLFLPADGVIDNASGAGLG